MTAMDDFLAKLAPWDKSAGLGAALPASFTIDAAGPYPLAKHVEVEGSEVGGELLLAFDGISLAPVEIVGIRLEREQQQVTVALAPARLTGNYELFALETPRIDMDTGGMMSPLATFAGAAPDDDPPTITEQQYDQLQQARAQQVKLNQTPQGQALVKNYNAYNDIYNDAFNTNGNLRTAWATGNATQEMMDHTSAALNTTDQAVNPGPETTFGQQGYTYNQNAWMQKTHVFTACYAMGEFDAANAAATFSTKVTSVTGNSQTHIVPMTGPDVYNQVNAQPVPPSGTLLGESDDARELCDALGRIAENCHGADDLAICANHGFDIGEEHAARLQAIYAEGKRVRDPKARLPVRRGEFEVDLPETRHVFALTEQPDDSVTLRLMSTTLSLAGLDLGEAGWEGEPGQVARGRLAKASFIRGMIADRISSQLTRAVRAMAAPRG